MIYIYSDKGVCAESCKLLQKLFSLFGKISKTISHKQVEENTWSSNAQLFVLPGGSDLPYLKSLQGKGNKTIKDFVTNGGSFLGICAGAYYGANYIEFDKNYPLEVVGKRPLNFFPYKAIGPAFGKGTFAYNSYKGARAAKIGFQNNTEAYFFYNGGPYFENGKNYSVGHYQQLPKNPVAIVKNQIGKGNIILSGVHLEYFYSDLDVNNPYLKAVRFCLQKTHEAQFAILKNLLKM